MDLYQRQNCDFVVVYRTGVNVYLSGLKVHLLISLIIVDVLYSLFLTSLIWISMYDILREYLGFRIPQKFKIEDAAIYHIGQNGYRF